MSFDFNKNIKDTTLLDSFHIDSVNALIREYAEKLGYDTAININENFFYEGDDGKVYIRHNLISYAMDEDFINVLYVIKNEQNIDIPSIFPDVYFSEFEHMHPEFALGKVIENDLLDATVIITNWLECLNAKLDDSDDIRSDMIFDKEGFIWSLYVLSWMHKNTGLNTYYTSYLFNINCIRDDNNKKTRNNIIELLYDIAYNVALYKSSKRVSSGIYMYNLFVRALYSVIPETMPKRPFNRFYSPGGEHIILAKTSLYDIAKALINFVYLTKHDPQKLVVIDTLDELAGIDIKLDLNEYKKLIGI